MRRLNGSPEGLRSLLMTTTRHKWAFTARFRSRAYGWRGTDLATKRLKEAVTEIRKVARADPALAAEGAVALMERLWPALQDIDTSSGALGNAVNRTLEQLIPVGSKNSNLLNDPDFTTEMLADQRAARPV